MKLLDNMFCVEGQEVRGEDYIFRLRLLPECPIYQAHFPGTPITPGVCLIQLIEELLGLVVEEKLRLVRVKNVKFLQVLVPQAGAEVTCKIGYQEASKRASALVEDAEKTYAKMVLDYDNDNDDDTLRYDDGMTGR